MTSPTAASTPSGHPDAYCACVQHVLAMMPPAGAIDRAAFGRYADAADQVHAVAPATAKTYWAAAAKATRNVAEGGQGDPDAASVVFKEMRSIAVAVKTRCGIDLVASK